MNLCVLDHQQSNQVDRPVCLVCRNPVRQQLLRLPVPRALLLRREFPECLVPLLRPPRPEVRLLFRLRLHPNLRETPIKAILPCAHASSAQGGWG